MLKKISGWVGVVLSVLFLIVCVGIVFGVWAVNTPTTEFVNETLTSVTEALDSGSTLVSEIDGTLVTVRTELDSSAESLKAAAEPAVQALRTSVETKLIPALQTVDSTTAELVAVVDGFEATLSLLNRSPLSRNVEVPSGEKLAELSNALVQVNEQVGQLKTATISAVDTQAAAARFAEVRESIRSPIEKAQEATSKLKVVLADSSIAAQEVNAAFPQWMDWFTWGSTFMFSWLAIGQVALLRASWRWARGE